MADDKSYIREARELAGKISLKLGGTWRTRVEAIIATEFSRIASEATRAERERIEAKLIELSRASGRSAQAFKPREDGGDGSREQCLEEAITLLDAVAVIGALSSIPPQPSEEDRR